MLDNLSGITAFVQAAETRSFTEAGRLLEVSSSAIGKSIARMEAPGCAAVSSQHAQHHPDRRR